VIGWTNRQHLASVRGSGSDSPCLVVTIRRHWIMSSASYPALKETNPVARCSGAPLICSNDCMCLIRSRRPLNQPKHCITNMCWDGVTSVLVGTGAWHVIDEKFPSTPWLQCMPLPLSTKDTLPIGAALRSATTSSWKSVAATCCNYSTLDCAWSIRAAGRGYYKSARAALRALDRYWDRFP
jgi:hypothetical protein